MRIGLVSNISQFNRPSLSAFVAEDTYQKNTTKEIENALKDEFDVIQYSFHENVVEDLKTDEIDLVFNLCNGRIDPKDRGELPELLEAANIPYTGSDAQGHRRADDKGVTAKILGEKGVPVPETTIIRSLEDVEKFTGKFPLLIKPANDGSSRGVVNRSLVQNIKEMREMVEESLQDYDCVLATEYIEGTEITVGILGNGDKFKILPILEVDFSNLPDSLSKFYSFDVKHDFDHLVENYIPARFTEEVTKRVQEVAKETFDLLGIRDYARIDIRVRDGVPYVLEVNSIPGLNPISSDIIKTAKADGMTYDALIKSIVHSAIEREKLALSKKEDFRVIGEIYEERKRETEERNQRELDANPEKAKKVEALYKKLAADQELLRQRLERDMEQKK